MDSHIHCRARDKEKGTICALKKIKMDKHQDGFPLTSIREINILLSFHHPNIVEVRPFSEELRSNAEQRWSCVRSGSF